MTDEPGYADVAPRSVDATVSLDGDAFSRSVPVFAGHVEVALASDRETRPTPSRRG